MRKSVTRCFVEWLIKEKNMSDITAELAKLKALRGSDFVGQLKVIAARREFHALNTDLNIG